MGTVIVKKSSVKPKKSAVSARPKKNAKKVVIKAKKAEPEPESESESESEEELTHIPNEAEESESSGSESGIDADVLEEAKKRFIEAKEDDDEDSEDEEELGGFSSTDDEEDDEEDDDDDDSEEEQEVEPKKSKKQEKKEVHEVKGLPKTDNSSSKKTKKNKKGVIYIGRLPDGFEEKELSKYFSQFGEITNVKLARNKKTGNTRHFGFIEFNNGDDAKIAQETMNNYLLMNHQLKVELVNEDFKSSKKAKKGYFRVSKLKKDVKKLNENDKAKREKRKQALKAAGINF